MTKAELVRAVGNTTPETMQRALAQLQREDDAPIAFDRRSRRWTLIDREFSLPLDAPGPDDVAAVLFAQAMLEPLADTTLHRRLRRLAEQLDDRVQPDNLRTLPTAAISAMVTLGTPVAPEILRQLLRSLRRDVIRMTYYSPWSDRRAHRTVEPWGIRLHDGALYLRAYSRRRKGPNTYRLAEIVSLKVLSGAHPTVAAPPASEVWADADPAFGIDEDRPGVATIRLRGPVARWLHRVQWHPRQRDRWLRSGQLLERRLPYRSCRELARRLLSVLDAVVAIEPPALRREVHAMIDRYTASETIQVAE